MDVCCGRLVADDARWFMFARHRRRAVYRACFPLLRFTTYLIVYLPYRLALPSARLGRRCTTTSTCAAVGFIATSDAAFTDFSCAPATGVLRGRGERVCALGICCGGTRCPARRP